MVVGFAGFAVNDEDEIVFETTRVSTMGADTEHSSVVFEATGGIELDTVIDDGEVTKIIIDGEGLVEKSSFDASNGKVAVETKIVEANGYLELRTTYVDVEDGTTIEGVTPILTEGAISFKYEKTDDTITELTIVAPESKYTVGKTFKVMVPAGTGMAVATLAHGFDTKNVIVATRRDDNQSVFGDEFPITEKVDADTTMIQLPKDDVATTWFVHVKAAPRSEEVVVNAI
jgi:uncharacterized lipoprotein NlpE involved in copper resistance